VLVLLCVLRLWLWCCCAEVWLLLLCLWSGVELWWCACGGGVGCVLCFVVLVGVVVVVCFVVCFVVVAWWGLGFFRVWLVVCFGICCC